MDNKMDTKVDFSCNICNKKYAGYKSLWNHNKKFHNINVIQSNIICNTNVINGNTNVIQSNTKEYNCKYCNKIFKMRQYKWKHEQRCKIKENNKFKEIEEQNKQLMQTINELKNQVSMILKEKGKIHHKTLQKINNQLNVNQSNNINNGSIINNTYVKFGELEYEKILNNNQIKHILNKQYKCLEESIKQIHFNEDIPEYNNVFITNMKDDIAYVFNGKQFISIRKNEMLNDLIDTHIKEINLSLEKNKNTLNEKYVTRLEKFLDMLNDDDTKFTDHDNQRTYNSYKAYKINSIKLLIYNESDKKKFELLNNMELEEKFIESDIDSNY
jgi:hypothetical protein